MTGPHPLVEQAAALRSLGRADRAKELLARRLAQDPADSGAWLGLARCHLRVGEFGEVVSTTDEVLRLAPDDCDALVVRAYGLRHTGRFDEALAAAEGAVRLAPEAWQVYLARAEALGAWSSRASEALEAAETAVRLAPEEAGVYHGLWKAARLTGRGDLCAAAVREVLRIDPTDAWALEQQASAQAAAPGVRLPEAAHVYASALASVPASESLREGLDIAVYRMLRGTRWLAVLSLVLAGVSVDIFPDEGEAKRMPLPLGTRLYALALMGAAWGFGAWRVYRKLRAGVRLSMRALVRRNFWARLVLCQAAWGTLCALAVVLPAWSGRGVPQALFWTGLTPVLLTIWFDRPRTR